MSKLYLYCIIVIFVYVLVIYPLNKDSKSTTHKSSSGTRHGGNGGTFELKGDGVENDTKGQLRYRFGYTN